MRPPLPVICRPLTCSNLKYEYTVIRNGNFSALTLFDDIMLRNTYAAYSRTS
jgi:hypothetical protein